MQGIKLLFSKEARKKFARGLANKIINEQQSKKPIINIIVTNSQKE